MKMILLHGFVQRGPADIADQLTLVNGIPFFGQFFCGQIAVPCDIPVAVSDLDGDSIGIICICLLYTSIY